MSCEVGEAGCTIVRGVYGIKFCIGCCDASPAKLSGTIPVGTGHARDCFFHSRAWPAPTKDDRQTMEAQPNWRSRLNPARGKNPVSCNIRSWNISGRDRSDAEMWMWSIRTSLRPAQPPLSFHRSRPHWQSLPARRSPTLVLPPRENTTPADRRMSADRSATLFAPG